MTYPTSDYSAKPPSYPPGGSESAAERLGRVGRVIWTFAQTVRGAAATLIPWLVFIWGTQLLIPSTATTTAIHARLSMAQDIAGGIFAFIVTGVVEVAFLIAPLYYTVWRRNPGISPREGLAALGVRRMALGSAVMWAIGGFIVIIGSSFLYSFLVTAFNLPLHTNSDAILQEAQYAPISALGTVAGAVIVAPICEEIFFRGYLFGGLLQRMSFWPAALLSALLFALAHGDIGSALVLFVFGLVLAFIRMRVGSIWPSVIIHTANNATAALAIILVLSGR